ncbi:MAG: menaquinone-dependent protoporphyrinogen IX dehydrogenase [Gammaproteobacteria bacterium]|nr:menaquinone-dependent protoporphyrinogen IX dehydrogenase [Gammaproteobacteria bacterium]
MARILIVFSSVDGHTRSISEFIAARLRHAGHQVQVQSVDELPATPEDYDSLVVGASIRYGKYRPALLAFTQKHAGLLNSRPSAFFSVNLVARKPGRDTPATNPYVKKLLSQTRWRPAEAAVFAGKLDYPRYRPVDRWIIRLIMWMTGGPTAPASVRDFTDWQKVEAFAARIARLDPARIPPP